MEIFKTREAAEEAKKANPQYSSSDMTVKVDGGFAIMTAREYIDWLVKQ
jgi:hypothetical protein